MARRMAATAEAQQVLDGADPLLENMNPEQAAAIRHGDGPLCVLAGAGSGKTRVLIHRIACLVRSGVKASRILAVTFSKNAADEMKERGRAVGLHDVEFRTWHSLALHILRDDDTEWASWKIDDSDRAKFVLKDVLGFKNMRWEQADLGAVASFIGYCKSQLWSPDSDEALTYGDGRLDGEGALGCEAFERYNRALEQERLLTFDDFLVHCVEHLEAGNAEKWAATWDYLLQDECQDASPSQMRIANLLAGKHRNYMVVGDPSQAIYSFRGSASRYIMQFGGEWSATTVSMHRNYRCGRRIIDVANAVIRPSTQRLPEDIVAEGGWDGVVTWRQPGTLEDEGDEVVGAIREHEAEGSKLGDSVVLYRINAMSRAIEESLLAAKIPYVVVGGVSFYERKEVKDLLAYLRLIDNRAVRDNIKRAINAPFRFLGIAYLEKVLDCLGDGHTCKEARDAVMEACTRANVQRRQRSSASNFCDLLARCEVVAAAGTATPAALLQTVLDTTQYEAWLKRDSGEESLESSHVANVKELVRVAARFATVRELLDFVDATIASAKQNKEDSEGRDRVLLMSIHRAKGQEYKHVHFVGVSELIIPHPRAEDIDEERRLAYVAITRAKQTLLITSPKRIATKAGIRDVAPSRFVVEAGLCS